MLEHYETLAAAESEGKGDSFKLNAEDCMKLHQEGVQPYHRYVAFFQLQNFEAVIRDTKRNLRLFDFVARYAEKIELADVPAISCLCPDDACPHKDCTPSRTRIIPWRSNTRNGASRKSEIRAGHPASGVPGTKRRDPILQNWIKELREQRPLTPREKLQRQMTDAVAARIMNGRPLRDALRELL